jgi:hypothetical protein
MREEISHPVNKKKNLIVSEQQIERSEMFVITTFQQNLRVGVFRC